MPRQMNNLRIVMDTNILLQEDSQTSNLFKPGVLFNFALKAQNVNHLKPHTIEMIIVNKDSPEETLQKYRYIDQSRLNPLIRINTNGLPIDEKIHQALQTDLFLSADHDDVQMAINFGVAAAQIITTPKISYDPDIKKHSQTQINLFIDGDGVAVGSESEASAKELYDKLQDFEKSISYWEKEEYNNFQKTMSTGPFTNFLQKTTKINHDFIENKLSAPFSLSLLTARGGQAAARMHKSALDLGIDFNGPSFCISGTNKATILSLYGADLFVDDSKSNIENSKSVCPSGLVPYKKGSAMSNYIQKPQN